MCNTNNQNCSFYLTPSSGHQTPILLNQAKSQRMLNHYQTVTEQAPASETAIVAEEYLRSIEVGDTAAPSKVFEYQVGAPFESMPA